MAFAIRSSIAWKRERLIVIVAGYPQEMEAFVHSNPGLHSRFNRFIGFADYSPQELSRIFAQICREHGLQLTPALKEKTLHYFILEHRARGENFGNARLAQSNQYDPKSLSTLGAEDLDSPEAEQSVKEHRENRGHYVVHCHHCQAVYRWTPDMTFIDAQCTACEQIYNCEFGEPARFVSCQSANAVVPSRDEDAFIQVTGVPGQLVRGRSQADSALALGHRA